MNPLQQAITDYKATLLKLSEELGTDTHQQGVEMAKKLLKNPYLSYPLKQGLEAKLLRLQEQESECSK
jgi:hypothetical protein